MMILFLLTLKKNSIIGSIKGGGNELPLFLIMFSYPVHINHAK